MPFQITGPQEFFRRWQQRMEHPRFHLRWPPHPEDLKALGVLGGLIMTALLLFFLASYYTPLDAYHEAPVRLVTITPGSTTRTIAEQLYEEKIIGNRTVFRLASRLAGLDGRLKAGKYALSPRMSIAEVIRTLYEGRVVTVQVTIPEGFTLAQIRERLAAIGLVSREEFDRLAADPPLVLNGSLPPELEGVKSLEGYLFPDTYQFGSDQPPQVVLQTMARRFLEVATPIYYGSSVRKRLSFQEFVILASLVEAETARPEEKPMVAAVFLNRLQKGMPLQSCATINYLLPRPKARLYTKDLLVDSPYNTYLHTGLPPGPINSPGRESLLAAANPASVPYLYFVAKGDGTHYFSQTYEEHLRAQSRYVRTR